MRLNSEVLAGMNKMDLFNKRKVIDLGKEKSGIITQMGFDMEPYVKVTFNDGTVKDYSVREFNNLYVDD